MSSYTSKGNRDDYKINTRYTPTLCLFFNHVLIYLRQYQLQAILQRDFYPMQL